jgi:nucleoid DNA-binding protein
MTLTRREMVVDIAERTGLIQLDVQKVFEHVLDAIVAALAGGDKVELRNFGTFEVRVRKARVGRNPRRPEIDVPIPTRAVVKFKPGKEIKAAMALLKPPVRRPRRLARRKTRAPVPPPAA